MIENIKTRDISIVSRWYDSLFIKNDAAGSKEFYERIIKILNLPHDKKIKILDIGCGSGYLLEQVEKKVRTYGIDISKEAIKKAKKRAQFTKFKIINAENLPYPNNYFDFITCIGSLEHFIDMEAALKEMKRVSKSNSKLIIHVPNIFYFDYFIYVLLSKLRKRRYQINERFATRNEWERLIQKYFKIKKSYKYSLYTLLPEFLCDHFTFLCQNRKKLAEVINQS